MDVVMSISGFDSSGSSGVQADLLTFRQLGVYGACVVTTLAAQNTLGYQGLYPVTAEFVVHQMDTIMRDFDVKAVKVGLMYRKDIIEAVAEVIKHYNVPIILDPIIRTEGGITILDEEEIEAYREHLIPIADVVSMTVPSVSAFSNVLIFGQEDVDKAARTMFKLGARAIIVKGSDLDRENAIDSVYTMTEFCKLSAARVSTFHAFGSSCSYSAALAVGLARGQSLVETAIEAKRYVTTAMQHQQKVGKGMPPLNHFVERDMWEQLPVKVIRPEMSGGV